MRILRAADHKVMPWKNGGGTTTEIAVSPAGAALDTFDWRISMASVATDGPFSSFPAIDRTLAVLSGEGIDLEIEGRGTVSLFAALEPYAFPADLPTFGKLLGGPITDLNVMTRRGRYEANVVPVMLDRALELRPEAETVLVFVKAGDVRLGEADLLGEHDCLVMRSGDHAVVAPQTTASIFLIELHRA